MKRYPFILQFKKTVNRVSSCCRLIGAYWEVITQRFIPCSVRGCLSNENVSLCDEHLDWQLSTGLTPATAQPPSPHLHRCERRKARAGAHRWLSAECRWTSNVGNIGCQPSHQSSSRNKRWLAPLRFQLHQPKRVKGVRVVEEWLGGHTAELTRAGNHTVFLYSQMGAFFEQSKWLKKHRLWMSSKFHNQTSYCSTPAQTEAAL